MICRPWTRFTCIMCIIFYSYDSRFDFFFSLYSHLRIFVHPFDTSFPFRRMASAQSNVILPIVSSLSKAITTSLADVSKIAPLSSTQRAAETSATPSYAADSFGEWRSGVRRLFSTCLRDILSDVMDDSGRSVQPFLIEADALMLEILLDAHYDPVHSGQVLHLIYLLEREISRITEGHRQIEVVFFRAHESIWNASPFLRFVRAAFKIHLRDVLRIRVLEFDTVGPAYFQYLKEGSPLFVLVGDGVLSEEQKQRLQSVASFGGADASSSVDTYQLELRLKSLVLTLARRTIRLVRLPELVAADGMLRGLLITVSNPALFALDAEVCFPVNSAMWGNSSSSSSSSSASTITMETYKAVMDLLPSASLPASPRLALALAGAVHLMSPAASVPDRSVAASHAVLVTLHALLLEDLSLATRAQPASVVDAADASITKESKALRASMVSVYDALAAFAESISTPEENKSGASVLSSGVADAFSDVVDGRVLHRLLVLHLSGSADLRTAAESSAATQAWAVVTRVAGMTGGAKPTNYLDKLKGTKPANVTADGSTIKTKGSSLNASWEMLPPLDSQINALLQDVSVEGDDALKAKLADALKAASVASTASTASAAAAASATAAPAPAPAPVPEEAPDSWDEEPVDDWEAALDDAPEETKAEEPESTSTSTSTSTSSSAAAAAAAAEADAPSVPMIPVNTEESLKHWLMTRPLSDGASMRNKFVERHISVNPIRIPINAKILLQKLMDRSKDLAATDSTKVWQMPADKEIQGLSKLWGFGMTIDKARAWLRHAVEIKIKKAENRIAARFHSTKDKYVRSMKTPSKTVLRDIVATQQDAEDSDNDDQSEQKSPSTSTSGHGKGGAKGGAAVNNRAAPHKKPAAAAQKKTETIQERTQREVTEKKAQDALEEVKRFIANLDRQRLTPDQRIERLDDKLLAHSDMPSALYGLLELMNMRIAQWKDRVDNRVKTSSALASQAASEAHMEVAARLYQLINDLARRFIGIMTPEQAVEVARVYSLLGFLDSAQELLVRHANATGGDVTEATNKGKDLFGRAQSTSDRRYYVGMSRARFTLGYCGHTLLRNVKSAKDARVSNFFPDKWQRKLLDIVDRNESALVVAPTSAGKTLVSFYTVDQVVRQNKALKPGTQRGVVVFIAPTYALARQMESDIIARSTSNVYVHDDNIPLPPSMNMEVLITVPKCMEPLLVSPERIPFIKRIKYVVFDEVHSIGSTLTGPTWERIFLLIHSTPFLALSATVGGADRFHDWLKCMRAPFELSEAVRGSSHVQQQQGPSPVVHKISTTIRWSHLHHYFYVPSDAFLKAAGEDAASLMDVTHVDNDLFADEKSPPTSPSTSTSTSTSAAVTASSSSSQSQGGSFLSLHPCGTLTFESAEKRKDASLLANVEFSTQDTLAMYDTMVAVAEASPRMKQPENAAMLEILRTTLNPDKYFGFQVEKLHTLEYENAVKAELEKWHSGVFDTEVLQVVDSLGSSLRAVLEPLTEATRARRRKWIAEFLPFMRQVQERDWFPAIIFCLDRTLCVELAEHLVAALEADEKVKWTEEGDKRLDPRAMEKEREKLLKAQRKARDTKSKGSAEASKEAEEEMMMGLTEAEVTIKPYDPEAWGADRPDERFSFIREGEYMPAEELEYWESRAKRKKGLNGQHPLIKALFRGFGVHSFSVDKSYRDLVEVMFRARHLKFVIATETLGLGVNMPCRTTVFAFTTVELNPLNYRQMSGRAGRRGFDDKGQVVFYGIDPRTACRLMTSSLSELRGHFHLTCSAVLRTLIKYYFIRDANGNSLSKPNVALTDQHHLLARSFYAYSQDHPEVTRLELLHHFRFCVAYFQHLQLFPKGRPSSLAYLLFISSSWSEGAFIFVHLMRTGLIDALCCNFDKDRNGTLNRLMTVIAHLFFPIPLRKGAVRSDFPKSECQVILPPLDAPIAKAVKEHDQFVTTLLSQYTASVAATKETYTGSAEGKSDSRFDMPISGSVRKSAASVTTTGAPLLKSLESSFAASALSLQTRSPFAGLAGHDEKYSSAAELHSTVRHDLHVHPQQLPISFASRYPDTPLNAYALDFFTVENGYYTVMASNGLDKGRAWEMLDKFYNTLRVFKKALHAMTLEDGDESDDSEEASDEEPTASAGSSASSSSSASAKAAPVATSSSHDVRASEKNVSKVFKNLFERFREQFDAISRDVSKE